MRIEFHEANSKEIPTDRSLGTATLSGGCPTTSNKECLMDDDRNRPQPEIMPPAPKEQPERIPPEIPPDKDAPQKESPIRAGN
jgi:hypothetical protein